MITEEKVKEAKKRLRSGEPEGEIKTTLRNEGYTEEDIAQVFIVHKPDMRSWYLVFGIVFIIAGTWFFSLPLFVAAAILLSMYYADNVKAKKK